MSARGPSTNDGLTMLDVAKIVGILILVIVGIRIVFAIVGAVMSIVWTLLIGVAVVAALWVAWSLLSGGKDQT
jgi:hypothetical protein